MQRDRLSKLVLSALLCAIGIIIPMFSLKIVLEPASFTLGSHIAIMIGMFVSPSVAVAVSLGTTLGFFFSGLPIVIVLRAATHVIFALIGAMLLQKKPQFLRSIAQSLLFSFGIGVVHALCEVAVVSPFYFGDAMSTAYYAKGFATSVLLLVGVGTIVHSMVDFALAQVIWRAVSGHTRMMPKSATK